MLFSVCLSFSVSLSFSFSLSLSLSFPLFSRFFFVFLWIFFPRCLVNWAMSITSAWCSEKYSFFAILSGKLDLRFSSTIFISLFGQVLSSIFSLWLHTFDHVSLCGRMRERVSERDLALKRKPYDTSTYIMVGPGCFVRVCVCVRQFVSIFRRALFFCCVRFFFSLACYPMLSHQKKAYLLNKHTSNVILKFTTIWWLFLSFPELSRTKNEDQSHTHTHNQM